MVQRICIAVLRVFACSVVRAHSGVALIQINRVFADEPRRGRRLSRVSDRTLYLPKEWTDDPDRLKAAYVPAEVGYGRVEVEMFPLGTRW